MKPATKYQYLFNVKSIPITDEGNPSSTEKQEATGKTNKQIKTSAEEST